uniref:Uncharacterized protein n=1 Tax=Clastoptera arizonana TaxID=38151 RepID=A0A1B6DXH9_9HEMI
MVSTRFISLLCCIEFTVLTNAVNNTAMGINEFDKIFEKPKEEPSVIFRKFRSNGQRNVYDQTHNSSGMTENEMKMIRQQFRYFANISEVLRFFEKKRETTDADIINEIFDAYNSCLKTTYSIPELNRKPFVVIESRFKQERDDIMMSLCKKLGAKCIKPPHFKFEVIMNKLKHLNKLDLLSAVELLSMYEHANTVRKLIQNNHPVVSGGYFTEFVSRKLIESYLYRPLPSPQSLVYRQPEDLMKPDVIFYVDFITKTSLGHRSIPKHLHVYYKFKATGPIKFVAGMYLDYPKIMLLIKNILLKNLDKNLNIVHKIT